MGRTTKVPIGMFSGLGSHNPCCALRSRGNGMDQDILLPPTAPSSPTSSVKAASSVLPLAGTRGKWEGITEAPPPTLDLEINLPTQVTPQAVASQGLRGQESVETKPAGHGGPGPRGRRDLEIAPASLCPGPVLPVLLLWELPLLLGVWGEAPSMRTRKEPAPLTLDIGKQVVGDRM